jgi:hypothetical protein
MIKKKKARKMKYIREMCLIILEIRYFISCRKPPITAAQRVLCWFLGGAAMWINLIDTMMHVEDKEKTEEAEFSQLCGCRLGSVPLPK